jgi:hypothetical protein
MQPLARWRADLEEIPPGPREGPQGLDRLGRQGLARAWLAKSPRASVCASSPSVLARRPTLVAYNAVWRGWSKWAT